MEWEKDMNRITKTEIVISTIFLVLVLAWWFRYDTHCSERHGCIAYDRFTMNWISPVNIIGEYEDIKQTIQMENKIKELIAYKKIKFDYKKALMDGVTHAEIIEAIHKTQAEK